MKLLKQYELLYEAEQAAEKLENKGILVHISSKYSNHLSRHLTGSLRVGLWSVLEHQYFDAENFLKNKKHRVTTGLTTEELVSFKSLAKRKSLALLSKYVSYVFLVILFILMGIYYLLAI